MQYENFKKNHSITVEYFLKKQNLTNIKHYSIKTIINRYIQHTCLCFFLKCLCYSLILTSTVTTCKSAFRKPKTNNECSFIFFLSFN